MSVQLDNIIPWGRSFDEYRRMFLLNDADLRGAILGCGDGPASFNAEMHALGHRVVSCDPIYAFTADQIRSRFEVAAPIVISQVKQRIENYVWSYHRDPDELLLRRREALEKFLADYPAGMSGGRYITASLPELPFGDGQFDLSLCSHLLFLYSDLLTKDFHIAAIDELCRVSRELRIFPLTSLDCEQSKHLEPVCDHARQEGHDVAIIKVPYQLQRNGDQMLRIRVRPNR